jgi:hypothetical protein
MFTFSKNKNTITGTVNGNVYGIPYSDETFKLMQELEDKFETATTGAEAKAIVEEFKALTEVVNTTGASDVHPDIYVSTGGKYFLKVGNKVTSVPMPSALVTRIKDSLDKGIAIDPLIKFWIRFLRNYKLRVLCTTEDQKAAFAEKVFNYVNLDFVNNDTVTELMEKKGFTREVATQMATVKQVKITKEGLLATFKVSTEITKRYRLNDKGEKESYDVYEAEVIGIDPITGMKLYSDKPVLDNESRVFQPAVMGIGGDAFLCGETLGHIIRVGQVHKLEKGWNQINTSDHQSCVPGLHIGGLSYIRGYQNDRTETHNVLVDPAHIGAVPDDSTGAIRCIQYYVLDAFSGVNGSIYHSSAYGKLTDDQWTEEKEQIIKDFGDLMEKKTAAFDSSMPE